MTDDNWVKLYWFSDRVDVIKNDAIPMSKYDTIFRREEGASMFNDFLDELVDKLAKDWLAKDWLAQGGRIIEIIGANH